MTPAPMRKQKINEPAMLIHTAQFIAELKGETFEAVAEATTVNAKSFFNLPV
jgi:TatD DNase family protein